MPRSACHYALAHGFAAFLLALPVAAAQPTVGKTGPGVIVGAAPASVTRSAGAPEPEAADPMLHPVTEEFHVERSSGRVPADGKDAGGGSHHNAVSGTSSSENRHVKRQGYLALHTTRIHPHPDLRHATDRYDAIDVSASDAEASIRRALQRPLAEALEFDEQPLRSVIDRLVSLTGVPMVPDILALEEAGLDLDALSVTADVRPVSLRSALRLLLSDLDLTYLVRDEVVHITTKDRAQEALVVRMYPVPGHVGSPTLIDVIQNSVAADTWNTVGGQGSIQPAPELNYLVIAQTEEVHDDIVDLLRVMLDGDLGPSSGAALTAAEAVPMRLYAVGDDRLLQELSQKLAPLCNSALGPASDPDAKVTAIGGRLAVLSRKRGFHAYAAEIIQAITGVDVTTATYHGVSGSIDRNAVNGFVSPLGWGGGTGMGGMGGGMGMGLCWVAREVYGTDSPRWSVFRDWLLADAPLWLRSLYATQGESFAHWLHVRPAAKFSVRWLMDVILETTRTRSSRT